MIGLAAADWYCLGGMSISIPEIYLDSIIEFAASGHIVDHITFVDIAVSVVTARLKANGVINKFAF